MLTHTLNFKSLPTLFGDADPEAPFVVWEDDSTIPYSPRSRRDRLVETVAFASAVVVPQGQTYNYAFLGLNDHTKLFGPALPGPYSAIVTSHLLGYSGGGAPFTGPYFQTHQNDYIGASGFCCGAHTRTFSMTGMTTDFQILAADPLPIVGAYFGFGSNLPATPQLISGINGGSIGHPVFLPSGMIGAITSGISGGVNPSEEFYTFRWGGGLFQTQGTISGANPLAAFQFELRNPYTHNLLNGLQLDSGNGFSGLMTLSSLAGGLYEIGLRTSSPFDPMFTINFNTPVFAGAPEPTAWATLLLGFGGLGAMARRRRRHLA